MSAGQVDLVAKQAHKIKGVSATVGGDALSDVASMMEETAQAGDLATLVVQASALESQFAALQEVMMREICIS